MRCQRGTGGEPPDYRSHRGATFSDTIPFIDIESAQMPHVRKLQVGHHADENPNEIVVSFSIPRAANDLRSIDISLPELQRELDLPPIFSPGIMRLSPVSVRPACLSR
jgi:hypothetical protein